MNVNNCGVLYVATGDEYVTAATNSARSFKNSMPEIPVAIATDASSNLNIFDQIIHLENPEYDYVDKINGMLKSPFERTVFLDADTHVNAPFPELFNILDQFDIAAAIAAYGHQPPNEVHGEAIPFQQPPSFPIYNTGVISYRNSTKLKEFFQEWQKMYSGAHELGHRNFTDQESFADRLYHSNLRLATLTQEYNFRVASRIGGEVKIIHGRHEDTIKKAKLLNKKQNHLRLVIERWNGTVETYTARYDSPTSSVAGYAKESINNSSRYGIKSGKKVFSRIHQQILSYLN